MYFSLITIVLNIYAFMKKYFYLFTLILLSLLCLNSKATHIRGLEISYQCTDTPQVYKVTIKVYRDCSGIEMCPNCSIPSPNGSVSSCNTNNATLTTSIRGLTTGYLGVNYGSFVLNAVGSSSGYDIVNTCDSIKTVCTNCNTRTAGTFSPSVEVYTFEGNVNLSSIPTACCRIAFGASYCCRNPSNLFILSNNAYTYAELDRCQPACNSSPIFTVEPNVKVTTNVDYIFNLGAIDPDGDSLTFTFGESYQSFGIPVTYDSFYSATHPFPVFGFPLTGTFPPPYYINNLTGDIQFRPLGNFPSQLVIEVIQWRKVSGIWLNVGVTRRDVEFQPISYVGNKVPIIKIYKNSIFQTSQQFTVNAGQQICLDIVAEDRDFFNNVPPILTDTADLKWNNPGLFIPVMANATFTRNYILSQRGISGPKADSMRFCWTPPLNAARREPYMFTVTGSDRFCPLKGLVTRGIKIKVDTVITILIDSTTKNIFCNNRITSTNLNYKTSRINLLSSNVFTVQLSDSAGTFTNATTIGTKTATDTVGFIPISLPSGLFLNRNYKIRVNASSDTINKGAPIAINIVSGFNKPVITNNQDSFCEGLFSTFKVTPNTAGLTFKWLKNNIILANETKDSLMADSSFTYRAIVSNTGCSDTSNAKYLTVYPKPNANFTLPTFVCLKNTSTLFNLVNTSIINSGIMSHNWNFSDNTISNLLNPTKTVTDTGNLVVKLITTSNNGCADSLSKTVNVRKAPKAFFLTYDTAQCITNNNFEFWNQSEEYGQTNQYTWNFGVGNNVISNNLFRYFAYNFPGTYLVKLVALSSNSCADTFNQIVNVADKVTSVNFAINETVQCLNNNNFIFTNQSTPNNSTLKYKWDFGNGDTSTLSSPTYRYTILGGTAVKLIVTANNECVDSISKTISVNADAVANFSIANAAQCLTGNNFSFTNSSSNSNTQTWNFGDASNSTVLSPTKTYTNAGTFAVKLLAKNTANCNDSITKTVTVYPSANLSFGINNASQCLKNNVFNFTNTSSISSGSVTYKWVLGEADTTTNTSKTFTQIGNYKIYLLSLTHQNCADSFSKDIVVKASPTIGTISGNAAPTSITTPFAYTVSSQANSTYNWTTTNGTIQSGLGTNAVNVVWPSIGTGSLKAKITNNNGCSDSTNLSISITSVGINNLSLENDLNVYPNPTKSNITITNKNSLAGKKYIITNLIGQTVITGKLNLDETIVNLETLKSGVYLLSIDGMNKQSIKVIKE